MALIEGLAARIESNDPAWFATVPQTLEERATWIASGFRSADEHTVEAAAEAVLCADPRRANHSRGERSQKLLDVMA